MKNYSFKQCSLAMLDKMFGLEQNENSDVLDSWLNQRSQMNITSFETAVIENLQHNMKRNIFAWNEEELAQHFIGPVITWAKL